MSMSVDQGPSPPIESRADLIEAMARGNKPKSAWRVGTEHEKFVFDLQTHRPVSYEGKNGIRALLEGVMARSGWTPVHDGPNIIGLKDKTGGGAISLEPGGQFELSGAPLESMHETFAETGAHLEVVHQVAGDLGLGFLGLGVAPTWTLQEIPVMPKSRYAIMAPYMDKVGTRGRAMMFQSCTVQANLDFSSEADMVQKLRVGVALQPVATALFANSPFLDGQPSGFLSYRSHIWLDTDRARTGMLPFAFEPGMGFERYADYALDVPMYFIVRHGRYVNCAGESFRAFLEGRLSHRPGERPTIRDWEDHLSTIFPEVRLKQFLEMRGADCGSLAEICALPALWTGLLYEQSALDAAWDLVKDWTPEERQNLREEVPRAALQTEFRGRPLLELAREVVKIARAGLSARDRRNAEGADETLHLEPLETTLALGKTPAQRWLAHYADAWKGDLSNIFREAAL